MLESRHHEPPSGLLTDSTLFLDFDGTLVEIAPSPESISPAPDLPGLLQRLSHRLEGRLALVSGRSVADLSRWLPDYAGLIAGSHGGEIRWRDGRIEAPKRSAHLDAALAASHGFAATHNGVTVEDKSLGIGLHYRAAPHHEAAVVAFASDLAQSHAMAVQKGKMVIELRERGFDKGSAVHRLMADPAIASPHPVFIGDDLTDIPAMAAVIDLGGCAIEVGQLPGSPARYRFGDVARTLDWLKRECTA